MPAEHSSFTGVLTVAQVLFFDFYPTNDNLGTRGQNPSNKQKELP